MEEEEAAKEQTEGKSQTYRISTQTSSILVITVANNPLRASRVPVYTNVIDHNTSHLQFEGKFLVLKVTINVYFKVRDNDNTFWWENYFSM